MTKVPPDSFLCPRFCFTNKPKEQDLWKQQKQNGMTPLSNFSSDILNFSVSLGYLKRLSEKLREVFIFSVLLYTSKVLLHLHTKKFILISLHAYGLGQKEMTAPTDEDDCFICTSVFLRGLLSFRSHQNYHVMPKHLSLTCHIILHKIDPNSNFCNSSVTIIQQIISYLVLELFTLSHR